MTHTHLLAAAFVAAAIGGASAQQEGLADQGERLARQTCLSCHAIGRNQTVSPVTDAPAFQTLAATPGVTSIALTVALSSAHKTMPNIPLSPEEMRDITAYILSMRPAP